MNIESLNGENSSNFLRRFTAVKSVEKTTDLNSISVGKSFPTFGVLQRLIYVFRCPTAEDKALQ